MAKKIPVGVPFPDEVFACEKPQENYIADFSLIDFSSMGVEGEAAYSPTTAFTYIRNVDLNIPVDTSKLAYKQKAAFLLEYINNSLTDLYIDEFATTLINILLAGTADAAEFPSIFTPDEQAQFVKDNAVLLDDIQTYLASIPVMLINNLRTKPSELPDVAVDDTIPKFAECIHGLFYHRMSALDAYLLLLDNPETPFVPQKLYTAITPQSQFRLFEDFYRCIFGVLIAATTVPSEGEVDEKTTSC